MFIIFLCYAIFQLIFWGLCYMNDFFMRCNQPHPHPFSLFGIQHIFLLMLLALALFFLLRWTKHAPAKTRRKLLWTAGILVPALELSHSIWLYLTGTTNLIKLLPLHLCGLQSLFIPLSVFTPFTCFQDFVYATSLLGGIFGTVFPAGIADYYPMFSFQTIQTFLLHGLLIYVPLALIVSGAHRPNLHRFPRVLCIFLLVVFVVGYVDFRFGENYMFLYEAPSGTPLVWLFETFGRQIYLLVTFLLLAGASFCIHLPFAHRHHIVSLKAQRHI